MGTELRQCTLMATLLYCCPLRNQAVSTMTWYPTQSHYPDIEPTSPCPILILPSTCLGSDRYQFYTSLVYLDLGFEPTMSHTCDRFGHCTWSTTQLKCHIHIDCMREPREFTGHTARLQNGRSMGASPTVGNMPHVHPLLYVIANCLKAVVCVCQVLSVF